MPLWGKTRETFYSPPTILSRSLTQGKEVAGFIDKAEFEKVKRNGENAVCKWIDKQLEGTSVTVVLIGKETLKRPFVQYEIRKSIERGNAIIGIHIHNIRDMRTQRTSVKGNSHNVIVYYNDDTYSSLSLLPDGV